MYSIDLLAWTNSFSRLPDDFYSQVVPTPFKSPSRMIHFNPAVAELIRMGAEASKDPNVLKMLSGQTLPKGADPVTMLYAGHPPEWAEDISVSCSS